MRFQDFFGIRRLGMENEFCIKYVTIDFPSEFINMNNNYI